LGIFLLHAKSIADSLAAAGSPISDTELIESIIDGLGHEYKEFIIALHLRPTVSFDDFYDLILQEEHLLKRMSSLSLSQLELLFLLLVPTKISNSPTIDNNIILLTTTKVGDTAMEGVEDIISLTIVAQILLNQIIGHFASNTTISSPLQFFFQLPNL
jgi:hypothetical protein